MVLAGAIGAGCLLTAGPLPASVYASRATPADLSAEWTTTHSDEPSSAPSPEADAHSASEHATPARSPASRKHSATQPVGSRSASSAEKSSGTTKAGKPEPVGIQIAKLFRRIGADFEEFFVGTRTVDKDD